MNQTGKPTIFIAGISGEHPMTIPSNTGYNPYPVGNGYGSGAPSLEQTTEGSKEDNKKIAELAREARWQTGLKSVADTYR
ncbi:MULTISPECIES: hypothetical protein [Pseudomonas]|jgi:hypothetical protein|uniref:Type III secretion effector protein n=1 Tax=Pseudomonas canadensis TaxID=915099 RepID=A0ABZ1A857_9PSED|nr:MULTISPECIES: hypothetical protein [Pseudomonas]KAF6689490.1 hypothetical protein HFD98_17250 [Pseudomonas sp. EKM23D]MCF5169101.1 hypothetical protein [Pseudomonas canadensis]QKJ71854.1 hypothetical protein HRH33_04490 [Pseudomonas rhodesiae]WLH30813.1 hypothetical protein PSH56_03640 [Pseudomonas canadensis]WNJ86101.1 hypothetical protein RMQ99_05835 [Pseudomonas canadensis]